MASAADTRVVFDHHLGAFAQGIDALMADYTETSVIFTPDAEIRGLEAIRSFFQAFLDSATPEFWASFKVLNQSVDGAVAYLVWSAMPTIPMATDTLYVQNGKIEVQTFTPFSA
ncbi:nuclear transport factor 2 family protein [Rhodospirillaceae bacterium KN72]|uniref:Nuclear transport factor 2 family protein n=2 Tax=Pacificispira spongiicola TaxID=2729598 RepID=A0A7Y0E0Z8_9PROT|nr:nuclear transport factor 2 family protein [Pacificispira spongiicola]